MFIRAYKNYASADGTPVVEMAGACVHIALSDIVRIEEAPSRPWSEITTSKDHVFYVAECPNDLIDNIGRFTER